MSDRFDYYFKQPVSESELDEGFNALEVADRAIMLDQALVGIFSGGAVTQHSPVANLTVDMTGPVVAYDNFGQRVHVGAGTTNVNVAQDSSAVSTAVAGGSNEKWISIAIKFARVLSDPRPDGNSETVYFSRAESFTIVVTQGAESGTGTAVRPSLDPDAVLVCDVLRTFGQTQVLNANISTTRRQDTFVLAGPMGGQSIRAGTLITGLSQMLTALNNHILTVGSAHPANAILYAGGASWAGGTSPTNPSTDLETQIDKMIGDLSATTAGAGGTHRIGGAAVPGTPAISAGTLVSQLTALKSALNLEYAGGGSWAGGTSPTNPAATIAAQLTKIIADLAATTASADGASRLGTEAISGFSAGTVRSQLTELGPAVAGTAFTAAKTFNGAAGDTNAALISNAVPTTRKLLWEIGSSTQKLRFYYSLAVLEITQNARWNGTGFERDDASGASTRFTFKNDTSSQLASLKIEYHDGGSASPWTVWDGSGLLAADGGTTSYLLSKTGVTASVGGAQDGVVGIQCDTSGASQSFGASATFRAKFANVPSSVSYATIGVSDVNLGTAFAVGTTTFTTAGIFVTGASTASGTARCARSFNVS